MDWEQEQAFRLGKYATVFADSGHRGAADLYRLLHVAWQTCLLSSLVNEGLLAYCEECMIPELFVRPEYGFALSELIPFLLERLPSKEAHWLLYDLVCALFRARQKLAEKTLTGYEAKAPAQALARVVNALMPMLHDDEYAQYHNEYLQSVAKRVYGSPNLPTLQGLLNGIQLLNKLYLSRYPPRYDGLDNSIATLGVALETVCDALGATTHADLGATYVDEVIHVTTAMLDPEFLAKIECLFQTCVLTRVCLCGPPLLNITRPKAVKAISDMLAELLNDYLYPKHISHPPPHSLSSLLNLSFTLLRLFNDLPVVAPGLMKAFVSKTRELYSDGGEELQLIDEAWQMEGHHSIVETADERVEQKTANQNVLSKARDLYDLTFTDEEIQRVLHMQHAITEARKSDLVPKKGYLLAAYRYALSQSNNWTEACQSVIENPERYAKLMPKVLRNLPFSTNPDELRKILVEYHDLRSGARGKKNRSSEYDEIINKSSWAVKNKTLKLAKTGEDMLLDNATAAWATQEQLDLVKRQLEEAAEQKELIEAGREEAAQWREERKLPPKKRQQQAAATETTPATPTAEEGARSWGPDKGRGGRLPRPSGTTRQPHKPTYDKHHAKDRRTRKNAS